MEEQRLRTKILLKCIKSQYELCIAQTGCEPDSFDMKEYMYDEWFRRTYEAIMGKDLELGVDGIVQILLDVVKNL